MADISQQLLKITKSLFPTGRAFRARLNGVLDEIYAALGESEKTAYTDAVNVLDTILPDNPNFTADDASDWERRLGIVASSTTSLDDRKAAILRKYAHPGNILGRQHFLYIQGQLQAAGFNVFVHENLTGVDPTTFVSGQSFTFGGDTAFFGNGATFGSESALFLVVNSVDSQIDATFNLGTDFRNTFFIGGEVLGTDASVPSGRETEFRQLILNLKPTHLAAVLLITYT